MNSGDNENEDMDDNPEDKEFNPISGKTTANIVLIDESSKCLVFHVFLRQKWFLFVSI